MRVMVVGQGGREHALVKALRLSPSVTEVHAVPGSDGMALDALCHQVDVSNHGAVCELAQRTSIDLVVVGPEVPLADGLSDALRVTGIDVFGPSQKAAQLESSKIFSKHFMEQAGVPTAAFEVVSSVEQTLKAAERFSPPYILKADGLAAGKGVAICKSLDELQLAAQSYFEQKILGDAGERALLEQYLPGWELSFHIITNGEDYFSLPLSQDHKRLGQGDLGPNTGGMGVVGPLHIDDELNQEIHVKILKPTVEHLKNQNLLYRGVLYVGVMVTESGPMVLEYNVRFGDPETQVLMPLLEGDWGQVMKDVAQGVVNPVSWKKLYAACVVLAAEGYPESPRKGVVIEGDPSLQTASSYFLHAGTKKSSDNNWLVNGGRVLNAVGLGSSLQEAVDNAYTQCQHIGWPGMQVRNDIGSKILKQ